MCSASQYSESPVHQNIIQNVRLRFEQPFLMLLQLNQMK